MISECGLEVERLAKEFEESREKSPQLEGKFKVIEDAHSLEEAQFESRIGELERDLGKTASSLLSSSCDELPRYPFQGSSRLVVRCGVLLSGSIS